MEMKSFVVLESVKENQTFSFLMPVGSNLGEAYEACWECLIKITEMAKEAADKVKPAKE